MTLTHLLVVLGTILPVLFFSLADAGEVGVSYGRVANDLPDPASVVKLLKRHGITRVRLYDANAEVLTALANTGIKVLVMLDNDNLAAAAASRLNALRWARRNVAAHYPATLIDGVDVGNEVFEWRPDLTRQLVPAMINVQLALAKLGLADAVKVSTPIAFTALKDTFPPSSARFRDDIAQSVMKPMLQFLQRTGRRWRVARIQLSLIQYGRRLGGHQEEKSSPETTQRHEEFGGRRWIPAGDGGQRKGNNHVIDRVVSGKTGTPHRPTADMDVYIFALFNENQKGDGPDDSERYFGLFDPNGTKVYDFDFHRTWCVANASVGDARLQAELDYACGHGVDCGAIQPGGECFEPNTRVAHASYAFNSYYHRNHRAPGTCDFAGAAFVVHHAPKYGNCVLPSKP